MCRTLVPIIAGTQGHPLGPWSVSTNRTLVRAEVRLSAQYPGEAVPRCPLLLTLFSAFQQPVSAFTALLPLLGLPASPITIPAPSTFHTAARPAKKQFSGVCETLSVWPHWSLMPSCPLQSLPLTGSGICPPRNWKRWLPPGFIPLGAFSPGLPGIPPRVPFPVRLMKPS